VRQDYDAADGYLTKALRLRENTPGLAQALVRIALASLGPAQE